MTTHYEFFVCVKYKEKQKGEVPRHEKLVYFYKSIIQFKTWLFIHILTSMVITVFLDYEF